MKHILIDIKPNINKVKIWIDDVLIKDAKGATFTMGIEDDFTEIIFSILQKVDGELITHNYSNVER